MKTKKDNVIDSIGGVCDTKLSQWHGRSYRSSLSQNINWTIGTYRTECGLWWKPNKTMTKTQLSWPIVTSRSMIKTSQDNIVTDHIGLVYVETKIELLGPIWRGAICDENQRRQWRNRLYKCDLRKKWYWIVVIEWVRCSLWQTQERTKTWLIVHVRGLLLKKCSFIACYKLF